MENSKSPDTEARCLHRMSGSGGRGAPGGKGQQLSAWWTSVLISGCPSALVVTMVTRGSLDEIPHTFPGSSNHDQNSKTKVNTISIDGPTELSVERSCVFQSKGSGPSWSHRIRLPKVYNWLWKLQCSNSWVLCT